MHASFGQNAKSYLYSKVEQFKKKLYIGTLHGRFVRLKWKVYKTTVFTGRYAYQLISLLP